MKCASILLLLTTMLLAVSACDDDDGTAVEVNDPGTFSTSVPDKETKSVESLDATDFEQLCEDVRQQSLELVTSNREALCHYATVLTLSTFGGALSGDDLAQACNETMAACTSEFDVESSGLNTSCPFTDANRMGCTATVAEFETCFNDQKNVLVDTLEAGASISCTSIDENTTPPEFFAGGQPASCEALAVKCPGFFETTTTSDPPGGN